MPPKPKLKPQSEPPRGQAREAHIRITFTEFFECPTDNKCWTTADETRQNWDIRLSERQLQHGAAINYSRANGDRLRITLRPRAKRVRYTPSAPRADGTAPPRRGLGRPRKPTVIEAPIFDEDDERDGISQR